VFSISRFKKILIWNLLFRKVAFFWDVAACSLVDTGQHLKHQSQSTRPHGATSQKTAIFHTSHRKNPKSHLHYFLSLYWRQHTFVQNHICTGSYFKCSYKTFLLLTSPNGRNWSHLCLSSPLLSIYLQNVSKSIRQIAPAEINLQLPSRTMLSHVRTVYAQINEQ
jgi:hypothetical protein